MQKHKIMKDDLGHPCLPEKKWSRKKKTKKQTPSSALRDCSGTSSKYATHMEPSQTIGKSPGHWILELSCKFQADKRCCCCCCCCCSCCCCCWLMDKPACMPNSKLRNYKSCGFQFQRLLRAMERQNLPRVIGQICWTVRLLQWLGWISSCLSICLSMYLSIYMSILSSLIWIESSRIGSI